MKIQKNLLRWFTLVVLLCVGAIAFKMQSLSHWSVEMERKMAVGLPDHLQQPVLFAELARSKADFEAVFAGPAQQKSEGAEKSDVELLAESVSYDWYFIAFYTALLLLLGLRGWQRQPRPCYALALLVLPLVICLCDVMENLGILQALKALDGPALTDGMVSATRRWSMTKWQLFFLDLLLIAQSLVGTGVKKSRPFPLVLRRATALLLALGALVGLLGVLWPQVIASGFCIGMLAMLPLLLLIVFPDQVWGGPQAADPADDGGGHLHASEPAPAPAAASATEYASQ
ncbi:hypothetical protein [Prosthecobacter sp.]|uniref:hypothetical protein n=1 Tax=Prosthecobacter sp. TaxID=1965333 RepID=UPI003782FD28